METKPAAFGTQTPAPEAQAPLARPTEVGEDWWKEKRMLNLKQGRRWLGKFILLVIYLTKVVCDYLGYQYRD